MNPSEGEAADELEQLLEGLGEEGRGLSFVLAVVASGAGQDLLLARRERRGLERLATALSDAVHAAGRSLAPHPGQLPDLDPAVGDGWRQPWVLARLVLSSAHVARSGDTVRWCVRAEGRALHLRLAPEPDALSLRDAARALPGVVRLESAELLLPG